MLLLLLLVSASAVLQIEECGCTSADSASSRENLWMCVVGSDVTYDHFSAAPSQYALSAEHIAQSSQAHIISQASVTLGRLPQQSSARIISQASVTEGRLPQQSSARIISQASVTLGRLPQQSATRVISQSIAAGRSPIFQEIARVAEQKRATSQVCDCLGNVLSCLQTGSCPEPPVLDSLCNWNFGRLFGTCGSCSGLVQSSSGLASPTDLITRIQEYQPSLSAALVQLIPQISSISFASDGDSSLTTGVTLAPGVVDYDSVYNQIVYQLSQIFDLYPGTISWSTVSAGKRQISNQQIVLNFYDEVTPSSPGMVFVPAFVLGTFACLLRLI